MADIFISYSSQDKERIAHLAEMLFKMGGWSVWWDRDIPTGRPFDEVIEEELKNSRCVVVVWSKMSVKSAWVKTEAQEGNDRKILIPILIDDVPIPLAFRRLQTANLSLWKGSETDIQFKKLIKDITSILGHQQEPFHSTNEMPGTPKPSNQKKAHASVLTFANAFKLLILAVLWGTIGWAFDEYTGMAIGGVCGLAVSLWHINQTRSKP
jgi:hypothetical protein